MSSQKFCKTKQHWAPLSAFEKRSDRDGYRTSCRECRNEAKRLGGAREIVLPPEPLELVGFLPMPAPVERRALVYPIGYGGFERVAPRVAA